MLNKNEKGLLYFGHMARMLCTVKGYRGRERPRLILHDRINYVLRRSVKSLRNQRECMKRVVRVEEAAKVCRIMITDMIRGYQPGLLIVAYKRLI